MVNFTFLATLRQTSMWMLLLQSDFGNIVSDRNTGNIIEETLQDLPMSVYGRALCRQLPVVGFLVSHWNKLEQLWVAYSLRWTPVGVGVFHSVFCEYSTVDGQSDTPGCAASYICQISQIHLQYWGLDARPPWFQIGSAGKNIVAVPWSL